MGKLMSCMKGGKEKNEEKAKKDSEKEKEKEKLEFAKGWETSSNGNHPDKAFVGWKESSNNENIYVIRAQHGDDIVVGSLKPSDKVARIAVDTEIIEKKDYDVLCLEGRWMAIELSADSIPIDAIPGGKDKSNNRTYIGRYKKKNDYYIGNINTNEKTLCVPFSNKVKTTTTGEILVTQPVVPKK